MITSVRKKTVVLITFMAIVLMAIVPYVVSGMCVFCGYLSTSNPILSNPKGTMNMMGDATSVYASVQAKKEGHQTNSASNNWSSINAEVVSVTVSGPTYTSSGTTFEGYGYGFSKSSGLFNSFSESYSY